MESWLVPLMVSYGPNCQQTSVKCAEAAWNYKVRGQSALKITCIFFFLTIALKLFKIFHHKVHLWQLYKIIPYPNILNDQFMILTHLARSLTSVACITVSMIGLAHCILCIQCLRASWSLFQLVGFSNRDSIHIWRAVASRVWNMTVLFPLTRYIKQSKININFMQSPILEDSIFVIPVLL